MPTFHKGVLTNDWKRIKVDPTIVLSKDYENSAIAPSSLNCITTSADFVIDICSMENAILSDFNDCLMHFQSGDDPVQTCKIEKL